jgi:mannose-6-phosphate isomerase class I
MAETKRTTSVYPRGLYDPFPAFTPRQGTLEKGYDALAAAIAEGIPRGLRVLAIDGYHGVDWGRIREGLLAALGRLGVAPEWVSTLECLAPPDAIRAAAGPFLGGADPLFGTVYPGDAGVFFDAEKVASLRIRLSIARGTASGSLVIVAGCGAGLLEVRDALWYVDIPKDVIQERARAGAVTCLGETERLSFGGFYKRSYFFDWPALNRLKRILLPEIDRLVDGQDPDEPAAIAGGDFRSALAELAATPFRVRPWFYPGPWGGQFMKGHMGLDQGQPNFAWSFELIVPENGIVLAQGGSRLEFSFDFLMYQEHRKVLGEEAGRQFKYEWPIRLDYLDTIDGGNLSVQCHPRPDYLRKHFGETYTQDETYYIVRAKPDSRVYLGLTDDCDPEEFRAAVTRSEREGAIVDVDRFVNSEPSAAHDLFLIPNGTVHCSGEGNLVLEISSTPYIFTFKIYDYLRRDLNGNLRNINIGRAFDNIRFERRAGWVRDNLVAKPTLIAEGDRWKEYLLSDRKEFFYNIHRVEFEHEYALETAGRGFAVNLVEGEQVELTSANGNTARLAYLESMLIPAAAGSVRIVNTGTAPCTMVLVYVRPGTGVTHPLNDPIA